MKATGGVRKAVVWLDGRCWQVVEGRLRALDDPWRAAGPRWMITDFDGGLARTMTVEADRRYVELMVSRKLQDAGDFDRPVTVLPHWKVRRTKNATEIFFTAVAADQLDNVMDRIRQGPDHVLILPLFRVLHTAARALADKGPVAVVFGHDRAADVVVADRRQVYYARRQVAFDATAEQWQALWQSLETELETLCRNASIRLDKVCLLTWVDGPVLPDPLPQRPAPWKVLDAPVVTDDEGDHPASLLWAAQCCKVADAVVPPLDRLLFRCRQILPWALAACLLASAAAGLFAYGAKVRTQKALARVDRLVAETLAAGKQVAPPPPAKDVAAVIDFVAEMDRLQRLAGPKALVNLLSRALGNDSRVVSFKADWRKTQVEAEVYGRIDQPFEQAFRRYQYLVELLEKSGFSVTERRFDTNIGSSQFMVRFVGRVT